MGGSYQFWLWDAPVNAEHDDDWLSLGELAFQKPRHVIIRDLRQTQSDKDELEARKASDAILAEGGTVAEAAAANTAALRRLQQERRAALDAARKEAP